MYVDFSEKRETVLTLEATSTTKYEKKQAVYNWRNQGHHFNVKLNINSPLCFVCFQSFKAT